uniref:Serine/threonine/tyrosine interacting like 1 n=1 Tax=Pseudonaja textilis TaxID=8673 RepID=A0A670Y982_PSETE
MAGVTLCEPTELYNLLNQSTKISRLAEPNYLCLLDARTKREYNESHLMTALRVKTELEAFKTYPVEILPAKLYMGNYKQACDSQIQKDLKIKAHINICEEDDAHIHKGAVLVFSTLGISRCSTAVMAYLIHSCKLYLKVSVKCKNNIRPNRAFVKQLSDWEQRFYITAITDISEPNY